MNEVLAVLRGYPADTVVVSGGAIGIDGIAVRAARALGMTLVEHLPDWKRLRRRAGFVRNKTIVDDSDEVHAWWDGESRGTASTIELARKAGKPVTVHAIAGGTARVGFTRPASTPTTTTKGES